MTTARGDNPGGSHKQKKKQATIAQVRPVRLSGTTTAVAGNGCFAEHSTLFRADRQAILVHKYIRPHTAQTTITVAYKDDGSRLRTQKEQGRRTPAHKTRASAHNEPLLAPSESRYLKTKPKGTPITLSFPKSFRLLSSPVTTATPAKKNEQRPFSSPPSPRAFVRRKCHAKAQQR